MASDVKATFLTASGSVFAGRSRIKAIHYQCGSSPTLVLKKRCGRKRYYFFNISFC